jgi:hypothetical protein
MMELFRTELLAQQRLTWDEIKSYGYPQPGAEF